MPHIQAHHATVKRITVNDVDAILKAPPDSPPPYLAGDAKVCYERFATTY